MKTQPSKEAIQAMRSIHKKLFKAADCAQILKYNDVTDMGLAGPDSLINVIHDNLDFTDELAVLMESLGIDRPICGDDYDDAGNVKYVTGEAGTEDLPTRAAVGEAGEVESREVRINRKIERFEQIESGQPKNRFIGHEAAETMRNCAAVVQLMDWLDMDHDSPDLFDDAKRVIAWAIHDALMWEAEGKSEYMETIGLTEQDEAA